MNLLLDNFHILANKAENVDELNKLVLHLAVQGKLVEQDPNDEPASLLIKRNMVVKEQLLVEGKIKREKPLLPINEEDIPYKIPEKWGWVRLLDICSHITVDAGLSRYSEYEGPETDDGCILSGRSDFFHHRSPQGGAKTSSNL